MVGNGLCAGTIRIFGDFIEGQGKSLSLLAAVSRTKPS
jgi:hypothetical protein